jgi:hypothetical protein
LIEKAIAANIRLLNVAVEPVTIGEIYSYVNNGKEFINYLSKPIPHFDFKTIHSDIIGGKDGYILDKAQCLQQIKEFVIQESK